MIPYDLTNEFKQEYCRILIVDRARYERVLEFLQDDAMWTEQYERQVKNKEGAACTLEYDLQHLQSGGSVHIVIQSHMARTGLQSMKAAPWIKCDGAVYVQGFARVRKITEIEEIPHIHFSLLDNDEFMGMQCGRVVLICDDPSAPTLVDVGLCKSSKSKKEA